MNINSPNNTLYNTYNSISNNSLNYNNTIDVSKSSQDNDTKIQGEKKVLPSECKTCEERQYQDKSNDPGVSFKTAGHIDPSVSASVVASHEQEHVRNNLAKAESGLYQQKIKKGELATNERIRNNRMAFAEKGQVDDVKVIKGLGGGCDEAAVRAVKESKFTPGKKTTQTS